LLPDLSLNWIVAPVNEPFAFPDGISAFTFIVALLSVKSVASQVPAGAPWAFVTDPILAVTEFTKIGPLLELLKFPEIV
jgi:hypothetical protein